LSAQAEAFAGLAIDTVMRCVGVGDALVPAHPRNPCRCRVEGALKARCVAANAAAWPSISSLQQIVRMSILLIQFYSTAAR
jgi:hypothetical protein